jgi:hypothetical protein
VKIVKKIKELLSGRKPKPKTAAELTAARMKILKEKAPKTKLKSRTGPKPKK